MHFIYYINRLTATKVDSTYGLFNQQYTAYMSVAGLERMTTGSAVSALCYRAAQVDMYLMRLLKQLLNIWIFSFRRAAAESLNTT